MERTDIHRPSAINPSEYQYVGIWHDPGGAIVAPEFVLAMRQRILDDMAKHDGHWATHHHGGTCHVCGAYAIYLLCFRHVPSNEYIRMGEDCAAKLDCGYDSRGVSLFRHRMRELNAVIAGKRKAKGTLESKDLGAAWALYDSPRAEGEKNEESIIRDMVGKLVKYGSLSDKQYSFLGSLLGRIPRRQEIEAKRQAEADAALPIPTDHDGKRITIEGMVLTEKDQESQFGIVTKILVKTDAGWKVWGTSPSNISTPRGTRIRFEARIQISPEDPKFGFYSRPTGAQVITEAPAKL